MDRDEWLHVAAMLGLAAWAAVTLVQLGVSLAG